MTNNVVEVLDFTTGKKMTKFSDIIPDANGVRRANLISESGKPEYKTFFPDNWTEEDIVDAIITASSNKVGDSFSATITIKGKNVPIQGYFKSATNLITTSFPIYTP